MNRVTTLRSPAQGNLGGTIGTKRFSTPRVGYLSRATGSARKPTLAFIILAASLAFLPNAGAQPKSGLRFPPQFEPAEAERLGKALVADLLSMAPESATNSGVLQIREPDGQERELKASFAIYPDGSSWVSTYEAPVDSDTCQPSKLTVVRSRYKPNEYWLAEAGRTGAGNALGRKLGADEIMSPFAGSDFWIADLGLEFLHWPKQAVIRKEMRKGQFCDVLESTSPTPTTGGYSRVVAWIDIDSGGIVHADAYDTQDRLLKLFDPTALKKVNGQHQLKEMEIRNRQTGSRSRINFDLGSPRED